MVWWRGENRPSIYLRLIGFQFGSFPHRTEKAWVQAPFEEFDAPQGVGSDLPRTRLRSTARTSREANAEHGANRTSRGFRLAGKK